MEGQNNGAFYCWKSEFLSSQSRTSWGNIPQHEVGIFGRKAGGTTTTLSLQFSTAALFINTEWKLRITAFSGQMVCFKVIKKLYLEYCAISTWLYIVYLCLHMQATTQYAVNNNRQQLEHCQLKSHIIRSSKTQLPGIMERTNKQAPSECDYLVWLCVE